jgi:hypothetical protein
LLTSRSPSLSPKIALVLGLIFKVSGARHGAPDKRPIPAPAISKGAQQPSLDGEYST